MLIVSRNSYFRDLTTHPADRQFPPVGRVPPVAKHCCRILKALHIALKMGSFLSIFTVKGEAIYMSWRAKGCQFVSCDIRWAVMRRFHALLNHMTSFKQIAHVSITSNSKSASSINLFQYRHVYIGLGHIVTCMGVRVTQITGFVSDNWIY
jgi:hypothetical protein